MAALRWLLPFVLAFLSLAHSAQEPASGWQARYFPMGTREATEEFLRKAEVVKIEPVGTGVTNPKKLTLDDGRTRHHAIFKSIDFRRMGVTEIKGVPEVDFKDSWKFEVAAYELDKLLGIDMVPPTVARVVDGERGSVQVWIEGCMVDTERQKRKLKSPDPVSWNRQMLDVHLFDNLIFNIDRNQGNLLVSPEWKIFMIDHTRCFKNVAGLRRPKYMAGFSRSLIEALGRLEEGQVRACCDDYLTSYEIEALMERRDLILKIYRQRVAEKGERILHP